jgi:antitoxin VapB
MALNIKDPETERLASEVASLTGESKTRAIRKALEERKERLAFQVLRREKGAEIRRFLAEEVWPLLPRSVRGRRLSRKQEDAILGYGKKSVAIPVRCS